MTKEWCVEIETEEVEVLYIRAATRKEAKSLALKEMESLGVTVLEVAHITEVKENE